VHTNLYRSLSNSILLEVWGGRAEQQQS